MKNILFVFICAVGIILSCQPDSSKSTVHRRNFSKNVFEEEFASVEIGCDTANNIVHLRNTKWLEIDEAHRAETNQGRFVFELNKVLSLTERDFKHDLVLERIQNGAFMFRYTGTQNVIDTIQAFDMNEPVIDKDKIDSTRIFSIESKKYYELDSTDLAYILKDPEMVKHNVYDKVQTLYRNHKTLDKGRVVCACDTFN